MTKEQLTLYINHGIEQYLKANATSGSQVELGVNGYIWVSPGSGELCVETDVVFYVDVPEKANG